MYKKFISILVTLTMLCSSVVFASADNEMYTDETAQTQYFVDSERSLTLTQYDDTHSQCTVESETVLATTVRDGDHFTLTTIYKDNSQETQVLEFDIDMEELFRADNEIIPRDVSPVKWMSYHYAGDGYQTWPSNGAYLLIHEWNELYTGTSMSSTLRGYVNTFLTYVRDADESFQAACEKLVGLVPVVGQAKTIAELIGMLGGVNNNEDSWASVLADIVGVSTIPNIVSAAKNAINAYNYHNYYIDAYNNAKPYCTPW